MNRQAPAMPGEFRDGWRIVLGCSVAVATGVVLLFFTFSMFLLPLAADLGVTRGELGAIQALIVTAAIGSPVVGRLSDVFGFRPVYFACLAMVVLIEVMVALFASSLTHLAVAIAAIGFFGVGSTAVVLTRPVNAHFREHRGTALGLVAVGASITTMMVPPLLQAVMDLHGWRGGFLTLAGISAFVGAPAVALLLPGGGRAGSGIGRKAAAAQASDWTFLRERDFWLLTLALITMSLATAGAISQLSPMIQEEGVGPATGALALSLFAMGQFVGRLGGGWLLDRFEPRRVAFLLTLLPAVGFLILFATAGAVPAALLAAAIIGLQQGAELDIFAYFVARRFDVARYGTIYGALVGLGWIGNAGGIVGIGMLHDATGSYTTAQALGVAALALSALLVLPVRLPPVAGADPA